MPHDRDSEKVTSNPSPHDVNERDNSGDSKQEQDRARRVSRSLQARDIAARKKQSEHRIRCVDHVLA
jgi:hypothetical protein